MGDNKWLRNSFVYVIIMVAVLVLLFAVLQPGQKPPEMSITQVVQAVKAGEVSSITTHEDNNDIDIKFADSTKQPRSATKESQDSMADYLIKQGVSPDKLPEIKVEKASSWASWLGTLGFILPTLFL